MGIYSHFLSACIGARGANVAPSKISAALAFSTASTKLALEASMGMYVAFLLF